MLDVLLGHVAEVQPELVVLGVEVSPQPANRARRGRPLAVQRAEERRLARTGRTDDGRERAGRQAQGDVVQQHLARLGDHGQIVRDQR